jgi:hypothetical protein
MEYALCSSSMSQALRAIAFLVLRLQGIADWLWLEFQHTIARDGWITLSMAAY